MKKPILTKRFFKENPLDEMSAAKVIHSFLNIEFDDQLHAHLEGIASKRISDERCIMIAKDKEEIEKLDNGEAVVTYMRKTHDQIVDSAFYKKALTLETEAAPLIVKCYKTTGQERFVEMAFCILSQSDEKYARQLFEEYQQIRDPYAQAIACLLFGECGMEDAIPLLMKEYERFKKEHPEENYDQAPLLALYILYGEV